MSTFTNVIEISDSADSAVKESYTDVVGYKADDEFIVRNLTFDFVDMRGMGEISFDLWKKFSDITATEGDVIRVKVDGTTTYIGYITSILPDYTDRPGYVDVVSFRGTCEIVRAGKGKYTLRESSVDSEDQKVSTNIQTVYTDIYSGGQFGGKYQPNNNAIVNNSNITYSAGNNTLPALSINVTYENDSPYRAVKELVGLATSTVDQSTLEPYIYYVDTANAVHTVQRSTSILATFDIGDVSTNDDFIYSSDDISSLRALDGDEAGIINKVIINHSVISSTLYASQVSSSQTSHEEQVLSFKDSNLSLTQTSNWLDSWILDSLELLKGYEFTDNKRTHGMSTTFPGVNGYIKLTKDGSTTFALLPFRKCVYRLDSGGYSRTFTIGDRRPIVNTLRLVKKASESPLTAEDTTAPTVRPIDSPPGENDKTYTKIDPPIYLGTYAEDNTSVSTVKFYFAKMTGGAWGSYTLVGNGALQAAPDSTSQEYYEYNTASGYLDVTATPYSLIRTDIFRIKTVATDPAGNVGENVREYQLEGEMPAFSGGLVPIASPTETKHSERLVSTHPDGFKHRLYIDDQIMSTVVYKWGGASSATATKVDASGEHYYETAELTNPTRGQTKILQYTATTVTGQVVKPTYYVSTRLTTGEGFPVTVIDSNTAADEDEVSVPEFKNKIKFSITVAKGDYVVGAADVIIKIYNAAGTLEKTFTSVSSPAVVEDGTLDGVFYVDTDNATLALSQGFYTVTSTVTRNEKYIDETGTEHDSAITPIESAGTQFKIVTSGTLVWQSKQDRIRITTNETDLTDHDTRLPVAEKELNTSWSSDTKTAQLKFFDAASSPDASDGWFITNDNQVGSPVWTRLATGDISGVNYASFTVNQDDGVEADTYLIFKNGGTSQGALKFTDSVPQIYATSNYESGSPTWTALTAAASNKISDTYSATLYELIVDSADGKLKFVKDPAGTPDVLFTVATNGELTITNDMLPDVDESWSLGSDTKNLVAVHLTEGVYGKDPTSGDTWDLTYDGTTGGGLPNNIAMGFMDD